MLFFDQLSTIANHLSEIKYNTRSSKAPSINQINNSSDASSKHVLRMIDAYLREGTINAVKGILPKNKRRSRRLTRKRLKSQSDWNAWQQSEWKQLNQYEDQNTFGQPCPLPLNANVLDLLWTYNLKDPSNATNEIIRKARCVCNGRPSNKNTVIFGYTFAKMLDHVGSRIFWAIVACKNYLVRGADASNAFAEADAPKIPLYVRTDAAYREWYKEKYNIDLHPDLVLPVKRALQGHPEASRSWAIKIDRILRDKLHLRPTTHEPCLYHGKFKGKDVLFLRQVDDFAVASASNAINKELIATINNELTIDIKDLGELTRYNGVDVTQSRHYIKLSNKTYFDKVAEEHAWLQLDHHISNKPLPLHSDKQFNHLLENAIPPSTESEQKKL